MQAKAGAPRSSAREAFFLDFAKEIRARLPSTILMLTGGFRTRTGMESALAENACDIIGLGRPATVNPHFPRDVLLNKTVSDGQASMQLEPVPLSWLMSWVPIKVLGAGQESVSVENLLLIRNCAKTFQVVLCRANSQARQRARHICTTGPIVMLVRSLIEG